MPTKTLFSAPSVFSYATQNKPKTPNSKTKLINDYMQKWLNKNFTLPIPKFNIPLLPKLNSYSRNSENQENTVQEESNDELLNAKPQVVSYYKGVPIYQQLPDKLFRRLLGLPKVNEMSNQVLYSIYTTTDPDLDSANGDVACDSYNKIDEDIKLLKDLGVSTQFILTLCPI